MRMRKWFGLFNDRDAQRFMRVQIKSGDWIEYEDRGWKNDNFDIKEATVQYIPPYPAAWCVTTLDEAVPYKYILEWRPR